MGKQTTTNAQTSALVTVVQPTLRAARITAVANAYRAKHLAARKLQSNNATQSAVRLLVLQQVQALYAQHGLVAPTQGVRAVPTQQKAPASKTPGSCKMVRAWVVANPTATVAQTVAHFNGTGTAPYVNKYTVGTQHGIARSKGV